MEETGIKQINLIDVPNLSHGIKYFDGELGFADDIRSVIRLGDVFKVNFLAMVFCTSGSVAMKINSKEYRINANDGLLIDMQSIVSDIKYDEKLNCKIICISLDSSSSSLVLRSNTFDSSSSFCLVSVDIELFTQTKFIR